MIDQLKPAARERVDRAITIWLTTVSPSGQPQTMPVWFVVDGDEFLLYSKKGSLRRRNIASNPRVSLNLDGDGDGGGLVIFDGEARFVEDHPTHDQVPAYHDKYAPVLKSYDWSDEKFRTDYPDAIRIRPTKVRAGGG